MARNTRLTNDQRRNLEKRSGLDKLKQFIPNSDYTDALIEHAAKNAPELDSEGFVTQVRDNMVERSVAMLSYLRDNGYDFSVSTDRRDGQIMAKLSDSNTTVRILDSDENQQYVGRVHSSGVTYRFSKKTSNTRDYKNTDVNITPDMAVDLLKYSLGDSVHRRSDVGVKSVELDTLVGSPDAVDSKGQPNTYTVAKSGNVDSFTSLYSNGKSYMTQAYGKTYRVFDNVYLYAKNDMHGSRGEMFKGNNALTDAENFVENSRSVATQNFTSELKLEALDKLAQSKAAGEFDGMPEFSAAVSFVTDMQKSYYTDRLNIYTDTVTYPDDKARTDALYAHDISTKQAIDDVFGSVQNRSINPINVSSYMNNAKGSIANENNLLNALKTIQKDGEPYELLGDGFAENGFRDKMIAYDSNPVYDKDGNQLYPKNINPASDDFDKLSDFWKNIGNAVNAGLSETGVRVNSIDVDQNGVIHYDGNRHIGTKNISNDGNKVIGNIGQVFEPDTQAVHEDGSPNFKKGLIETKFNSGENYYIAPGYTAYVTPPVSDDDNRSYEERTHLRGYTQEMTSTIKSTLRRDVVTNNNYDNDNTSGLNGVYHRIYGDKMPLDFEEKMTQEGKDASVITAMVNSSLRRVRYDNCYKDGTNMLAEANSKRIGNKITRGYDIYLDNVRANMAVMDPNTSKGIFDPYATGTGTNQGIVRYLVEDAVVNPDGSITKGESTKSPLSAHPDFKYADHNPPDRLIMSFSNALKQSSTARGRTENLNGDKIDQIGVGTAHMSLGGYTQDDAFVVSKEFAEANLIRGKDDEMRSLQIGDKICDHSGNKGVISFVADRNADMDYYKLEILHEGMSPEEYNTAVKRNDTKVAQKRVIDVFRDNPALDVVGAPYTAPSRFNGGTARELIDSQKEAHEAGMPTTLNINGKSIDGALGYCNWIVTDMPVDEKTHIYETEGGRKASGQLVWGLAEVGAKDIIDEIYKYNNEPTIKAREMMMAVGLDMSQTGELHRGYEPHITGLDENNKPIYEQRNEFSIKDAFNSCRTDAGALHNKAFSEAFDKAMGDDGGFMKLPFPIKMASGDMTPEKLDDNGKGTGEYMLPVLAGKYRSSRETVDNKLIMHEYTTNYKDIYDSARKYYSAQEAYQKNLAEGKPVDVNKYNNDLNECMATAQSKYNAMADDIVERHFTGKHNIWKDEIMRKQLNDTATAVISPDPSLDINEIAMTATMAESLNIGKDKDPKALVWRDPLLSGGGIRYFDVRVIENRPGHDGYDEHNPLNKMVGISMNPSSATSFEGDFDGDSVGLYGLQTKEAKACAAEKLSFPAQMLNKEAGTRGKHNLYFQDGLDVAAGVYADNLDGGDVKARFEAAKALANEADANHDTSIAPGSKNMQAYEIFNEAMHDAHKAAFGCDVINYGNAKDHFESLIPMTISGAKGSPSKLINGYGKYFGCKAEIDDNYNLTSFEDIGKPIAEISDRQASLAATHAKAVLTGVAGKFSQHAIMMSKNADDCFSNAAAATALTHPVTQSVMQLKHDSSPEILQKIDMITNVAPALWAGHKIQPCITNDGNKSWEVVTQKNDKGQYENIPMSPDEWKKTFMQFYTDKNGLNVPEPNPEYVDKMAEIMTVNENGHSYIKGFDSKTKEIMPMEKPLDRLAYESNLSTLCQLADSKVKLFDGSVNSCIAPKAVRDNIAEQKAYKTALEKGEDYTPKFKALSAKDTQAKPVLDTPSVDAVDKILKTEPTMEIHIVEDNNTAEKFEFDRAGHQRHLKDGRVIDVKPTTVHRNYDKLKPEVQEEVSKSVVNKYMQGKAENKAPEYSEAEKQFLTKFKSQVDEVNAHSSDNSMKRAYIEQNADNLREYKLYASNMTRYMTEQAEVKETADNEAKLATNASSKPKQDSYTNLSYKDKVNVGKSVLDKCKGKSANEDKNFTSTEVEFCSAVRKQKRTYDSFKDSDSRKSHMVLYPDAFNDYMLFIKLKNQAAEEAKSAANAQVAAPKQPAFKDLSQATYCVPDVSIAELVVQKHTGDAGE